METNKNSKFLELGKVFAEISNDFKSPEASRPENIKATLRKNMGKGFNAVVDLALNASADDLALMSTETKIGAEFIRAMSSMRPDSNDVAAALKEGESSLQRYYKFKAESLGGENQKLLALIEANTPK